LKATKFGCLSVAVTGHPGKGLSRQHPRPNRNFRGKPSLDALHCDEGQAQQHLQQQNSNPLPPVSFSTPCWGSCRVGMAHWGPCLAGSSGTRQTHCCPVQLVPGDRESSHRCFEPAKEDVLALGDSSLLNVVMRGTLSSFEA